MPAINYHNLINFVESLMDKDNIHLNTNPCITSGFGSNKQTISIGGKTPALTVAHAMMKGLVSAARFEANKALPAKMSDVQRELLEALGQCPNIDTPDMDKSNIVASSLLAVAMEIEPIVMAMGESLGHTGEFYKIQTGTIPEVTDLVKEASFLMFTSEEKARGPEYIKGRRLAFVTESLATAKEKKAFMEGLLEEAQDGSVQDDDGVNAAIGWGLDPSNNYNWIPDVTNLVRDCEDKIIHSSNKFKNVDHERSSESVKSVISMWKGTNPKTGKPVSTIEDLLDDLLSTVYDEKPEVH